MYLCFYYCGSFLGKGQEIEKNLKMVYNSYIPLKKFEKKEGKSGANTFS